MSGSHAYDLPDGPTMKQLSAASFSEVALQGRKSNSGDEPKL
jgi:hypothetical protein